MSPAAWSFLGGIVTVFIPGAVAIWVARINRKPVKQSADVAGMQAANDEWRELKDEYKTERDALREEMRQVRAEVESVTQTQREMAERLREVEDDRDALAEAAADLAQWEDDGRPDPPGAPQLPQRIRTILARLHQNTA